jgi:uncharacterized protein (UPF0261 family)
VILILVMAEEKWEEADFLRREIEALGHRTEIADMGLLPEPKGACDITREEIIQASGRPAEEVGRIHDRGQRMPIMIEGAQKKAQELYSHGALSGIISLGGTTGTQMGTSVLKTLPFGLPKIAVSSTASLPGFASRYIGTADISLMHSVVEIAGLNPFMRNVLSRAAGAICGMVEASQKASVNLSGDQEHPMIAMTHFGPCETCSVRVRGLLEEEGYQVIGFSAAGIGDRAMEQIIERQNIFSAVIDLAPGGVGEELLGFSRAAGPTRLEAAGKHGIPQVIAPSGVNFGTPLKRTYKPEYESRKQFRYDSARTFLRLSEPELVMVAQAMAEKLNKALGPVTVVIPLGGWSSVDKRGTDFYDGDLDRTFVEELKRTLHADITLKEVDADLDTPEFARAVVDELRYIL